LAVNQAQEWAEPHQYGRMTWHKTFCISLF